MGSRENQELKGLPAILRGLAIGFRASSFGALFFLVGHFYFQGSWWGVLPLLATGFLVYRWPSRFLSPSMSVSLIAAIAAWVPLLGLFWLRGHRLHAIGWEAIAPHIPEHGAFILSWLPLFTMAALLSALALSLIGLASWPWRRSLGASRLVQLVKSSATACLVIFFALLLARLGWDFALLAAALEATATV